jgi:anti-sigma-K factor RskA
MNETTHQEMIDLMPAYALGILEADEAAQVSDHLETCPSCREELTAYEAVTDMLTTAVPIITPPADLKERLMSQTVTAVVPPTPRREPSANRLRAFFQGPRWQPVLAVAVLILIIGAVFFWWQNQNASVAQFILTPTEAAPGAEGLISVAADGEAHLTITNLPALTDEQQYQLWLIQDGQRDSGAVFSVSADGSAQVTIEAKRPLAEYGAFGITIEPAGGSPGPTGERVLGFNL